MSAPPESLPMTAIKTGPRYVIADVDSRDPAVQRLMMLGLVCGTEVELGGAAIGGDPLEIRVFGNAISLRREQARCFTVAPVAGSG